jgi:hypothetical protein
VGLLNTGGYYDELLAFLKSSVRHGFMSDWQMGLLRTGADAQTLLPELVQEAGLTANRVNLTEI